MPFLRFSKDRRGYENTYLLQAVRRRGDKDRPSLLYWFRTPPHVKIGRAAFDEAAIRALEDQHPEVDFDWPRILATRPPVEQPAEPERPPRRPRDRSESVKSERPTLTTSGPVDQPAATPPVAAPQEIEPEPVRLIAEPAETPIAPMEPPAQPLRRFVRVFDRTSDPESGEAAPSLPTDEASASVAPDDEVSPPHHLSDQSVVERLLGSEQLGRFRGQYAAALARIGRRIADPTLADTLRNLAERINPDAWVTEHDVRQGLAHSASVQDELAKYVGRRRRRRWRGRQGSEAVSPSVDPSAESPPDEMNFPEAKGPDEEDDGFD